MKSTNDNVLLSSMHGWFGNYDELEYNHGTATACPRLLNTAVHVCVRDWGFRVHGAVFP
jgi:hypothetical protein